MFIELLRSKASYPFLSSELQLQKLQVLQKLLGTTVWTQNLLYTLSGNLRYELKHIRVPIRKVKKFSGWVRNSSAVGSKKSSGNSGYSPETDGIIIDEEVDFFSYFSSDRIDFDDLGIPAETLLYALLKEYFDNGIELPSNLKSKFF
jgi:hypothetical protein